MVEISTAELSVVNDFIHHWISGYLANSTARECTLDEPNPPADKVATGQGGDGTPTPPTGDEP